MNCSLCHDTTSELIGRKGPSTYRRCTACRLIRIEPHPTDQELEAFYKDYVYAKRVQNPGKKSLRFKSKILPLKLLAPGPRFLDIGCNVGSAVEAARRLGCESYGIDFSPSAIEHARKLWTQCTFYNEPLEVFASRNLKFDIIFCTEVLEHIRDLHGFMRSLKSILNQRAVLFFTTPDSGHFRVPKNNLLSWKEIRPIQHLALFDKKNIRKLFEHYEIKPKFFYPMHRANMRFISRYEPFGQ